MRWSLDEVDARTAQLLREPKHTVIEYLFSTERRMDALEEILTDLLSDMADDSFLVASGAQPGYSERYRAWKQGR